MMIKRLGQFFRLLHINTVFMRHGLDKLMLAILPSDILRILIYCNPRHWIYRDKKSRGERLRSSLEELGPIFVKFGQLLSTRRDLIPEDVADELAKLQDQVPPFQGKQAKYIVERAYKAKLCTVFKSFDVNVLASASVAQVHSAVLHDGKEVIVKVLRPGIKKIIKRDVALLYVLASLIQRFWSDGRRLRLKEVVAEFEHCLHDELDLVREAANASQLRRNFLNSPILYVPEIYWDYTRTNVLVMEKISGISIANIKALKAHKTNIKKLAEQGVEIFFTQVFRDSFFHADMHPGNLFVDIKDPENPRYIAVDFGIVGTLSSTDQRYLAENFLAFFKRDYRRVAMLHIESGWVPRNTRVEDFESTIRTVCEPIFQKPLKDISFGQLLVRLFQTAGRFDMQVQPQFVLLQKTLLNIEGLGRQLYPELDLWATAQPFLKRHIQQQTGPKALLHKVLEKAPYWLEKFPELPDLLYKTLQRASENTQEQPSHQTHKTDKSFIKGFFIGIIVALVLAGALLLIQAGALSRG